jgi:DNA-directed RNA polymerase subunit M/transcription elongation factor TFIIS
MTLQRARGLAALSERLQPGDALDVEHACHCTSKASGASYRRILYYALYAIETGKLSEVVSVYGGQFALALPEEKIFGLSAARRSEQSTETEQKECRSLLADLVAEGRMDLPEAGVRCSRCSSNEVSFEFCQTRSADEGTTVYCCCLRCSKRWKM